MNLVAAVLVDVDVEAIVAAVFDLVWRGAVSLSA